MILHHGSKVIVDKPEYGAGKVHNDYGQGFYCTEDIDLAREWACLDPDGGFVNIYDFDDKGMRVLDLREIKLVSWMALLLMNRIVRYSSPVEKRAAEFLIKNYLPDINGCDIIIGYRADDSYFTYARAFLSNTITLQQLGMAVRLGDLGMQICLKSSKSFEVISFKEADPVDGEVYYPKRLERDNKAREAYYRLLEQDAGDGINVRDIMKKEMRLNEFSI